MRAYIRSGNLELLADAVAAVSNLAGAFGLEHEFTADNVNMVIAVANGITENGRPKKELLRSLGLPQAIFDRITENYTWSTGCGGDAAHGADGRVALSIILGDTALPPKKLRSCIVTGIIFGFGLGTAKQIVLEDPNDYVQFLLLAKSISRCETEIVGLGSHLARSSREFYMECILKHVKAKVSE